MIAYKLASSCYRAGPCERRVWPQNAFMGIQAWLGLNRRRALGSCSQEWGYDVAHLRTVIKQI